VLGGPRAITRRQLLPRRPELTGLGLSSPYVANVCFNYFRCFSGICSCFIWMQQK
jgi:hypothetical protein